MLFCEGCLCQDSEAPAFADPVAQRLLTDGKSDGIPRNMAQGIGCFAPVFRGAQKNRLRFHVEAQAVALFYSLEYPKLLTMASSFWPARHSGQA